MNLVQSESGFQSDSGPGSQFEFDTLNLEPKSESEFHSKSGFHSESGSKSEHGSQSKSGSQP